MNNSCEFCMKFNTPNEGGEWFDIELVTRGNFIVIPGLGPLAEGYLMILTRKHYENMAQLTTLELEELLMIKSEVREIVTKYYRAPIIFEHGSALPSQGGGSCINHAHFHILPLHFDILSILSKYHNIHPLKDFKQISNYFKNNKPYIYIEDQKGDMFTFDAENIPSQYLRRLIATQLGIPDQWDYALFPNYELITNTIKKLTPWPITTNDLR